MIKRVPVAMSTVQIVPFGTIFCLKRCFHSMKAHGYADTKGGAGKGP